jgi:hypothetical protein
MDKVELKKRIEEILSDGRLSQKSAQIFSNAYLAIIQIELTVELHTLQKVLGVELTDIKKLRGE